MRIISRKALREFWEKRPDAKQPLEDWYRIWRRFAAIFRMRIRLEIARYSISAATNIA
jgi:mRNA-degrading endonuclease HigB of HigAB toxin-antitoxin module